MRLKSLKVFGFKTFAEATTLEFIPGTTAVVGPNGSGKSNLVDAIRWVLGEQAPTRLRGKSSDDLIYAGNDSNAAAGMARDEAADLVRHMAGQHRLPDAIRRADTLARTGLPAGRFADRHRS